MSKYVLFRLVNVLLILSVIGTSAQVKNDSLSKNTLFFAIENHNFIKNNEYFNNIADGYTLLGSSLHPKLLFYPIPKAKLEFGVFGLTYAGLDTFHKIIPTFSFTYTMKDSELIMGTLQSKKSHHLIAPLITFESQLDERQNENGLQYLVKKKKYTIDTWINWEHFIFKGATKNEEFVMGVSASGKILDTNNWLIQADFQNLFYHRGGQINTNQTQDRVVFTMRNTALGLQLKNSVNGEQSLMLESYFLQNKSGNIPQEYIYTSGYAWLANFTYQYKNWKLGFGYWYGNQFVSPKGDDMFQSVSVKTDIHYENGILQEVYTGHTEPQRSLILGNLSYKKAISDAIDLGFIVNAYFQNYSSNPTPETTSNRIDNQFDYSMGLYIKYNGIFKLN